MGKVTNDSDKDNFYYMAGTSLGYYYGTDVPVDVRNKIVSAFKNWVVSKNRPYPLPTDSETVNRVVDQFIFETERYQKRGRRGN